jgi:hypothetical protein
MKHYTVKSFDHVRLTPAMLAAEGGRRALDTAMRRVLSGQRLSKKAIEQVADNAGLGKCLVRATPEFKAALWLAT